MIKRISSVLLLVSILFNQFNGAENCQVLQVREVAVPAPVNSEEDARITGIKRKVDDTQATECSSVAVKHEKQVERLLMFVFALNKAILNNLNGTAIVEYHDDPPVNFFDKLIRRTLGLNLVENANEEVELWDMKCTCSFDLKWHIEAFLIILKNAEFGFTEEILTEYFNFLIDEIDEDEAKNWIVRETCEMAVNRQFFDLFNDSFKQLEQNNDSVKLGLSLLLSFMKTMKEEVSTNWQLMCLLIVERFPRLAFHPKLRIPKFKGAETESNQIFIHFLPIYQTLLHKSSKEFHSDLDAFDEFSLHHLGDLEKITPMGVGGLKVIDKMLSRSKINFTAFQCVEEELKHQIVERIFDAVLLGLEPGELVLELSRSGSFSIFESFCKYSDQSHLDQKTLESILLHLIKKCQVYEDTRMVYGLIAYHEIPQSVWDNVKKSFGDDNIKAVLVTELFESFHKTLKAFDLETRINLEVAQTIELNFSSTFIDHLSDIVKQGYQLDVARLFLARSCGIPLESTQIPDLSGECFEWSEAVGFVNFYVERTAALAGYTGDIVKFISHVTRDTPVI